MEILINGRTVKEYFHNNKTYIEGRKGSIFSIRLKNNSSERTLFVPTVDGLSVMSGKDGSFDSQGYILDANSSMKIDGWRLNDNEVAEFYFSTVEDSYRKRQNKGSNVGSIGVAVFRQKEKKYYYVQSVTTPIRPLVPYNPIDPFKPNYPFDDPIQTPRIYCKNERVNSLIADSSAVNVSSSMLRSFSQDVGTGFGETKQSEVISVEFDRESNPDAVLEIFYNSREQLSKAGVDFDRRRYYISEPNSFPNENGYCERPKD